MSGTGPELGGSFALGPWRVRRAGYGAMQLAGDGVFGPPRDHDEALRVLRAAVNLRMMDPSEIPGRRFDAQLAALIQARDEGLIDGVGLSNISRRHLLRAVTQTEIACVQNLFNLADQRSADVLAECTERGIAFVPFCPLGWPGEVHQHLLTSPVLATLAAGLRVLSVAPAALARTKAAIAGCRLGANHG